MSSPLPNLSQIQLVGAHFIECAILNNAPDTLFKLTPTRFQLQHTVLPSFSVADSLVVIDLAIHCQPIDENEHPSPVSGRFRLHITFHVANLPEHMEAGANDSPDTPNQQLVLTLIGVAYSTARGLVAAKTSDTILQPFVLPLLDVRDLLRPENAVKS